MLRDERSEKTRTQRLEAVNLKSVYHDHVHLSSLASDVVLMGDVV